MFNAATISGEAAQGYSSGQAMEALEQIVREHLPANIGVEWSGLSYQEKHASGQTGLVLALALLFVFLFLAAQYESWSVPVAVILSLPIAGIGAYLGNWACGLENNIYFQIGLVMLVGLVAKNAILIVEFAKDEVDRGGDLVQSALHAARLRFRPIVMTSLAFILGMLPLVFAADPGRPAARASVRVFSSACSWRSPWVSSSYPSSSCGFTNKKKNAEPMKRISIVYSSLLCCSYCGNSCSGCSRQIKAPNWTCPRRSSPVQSDTLTLSDRKWWEVYTDTTLCRLIGRTLDRNRNMLARPRRASASWRSFTA